MQKLLKASDTNRLAAFFILLFYFVVRFGFVKSLDSLGEYGSYIFEIAFLAAVIFYYRHRFYISILVPKDLVKGPLPGLALGFFSFMLTKPLGLIVPFELDKMETIFLLLVLGPIIEELIFRFALWEPIAVLFNSQPVGKNSELAPFIGTTVIFSFAHFFAFWFTPESVHSFIIYQTLYVLPLALLCGYRRIKTQAMTQPVLTHICFNFGFLVASWF